MAGNCEYKEWRKQKRNEIRAQRKALDQQEVLTSSEKVLDSLMSHPFLNAPRTIASYMSFSGEIDTIAINQRLKAQSHQICLPIINPELKGIMDFYSYDDEKQLVLNNFKILEPIKDENHYVRPDCLEVILVPLVGFNDKGDRLGMGGGYYDRMLKKVSANCLILGLAYDFQLIPELKGQHWDMPLDEIITPTKHYIFSKKYQTRKKEP